MCEDTKDLISFAVTAKWFRIMQIVRLLMTRLKCLVTICLFKIT